MRKVDSSTKDSQASANGTVAASMFAALEGLDAGDGGGETKGAKKKKKK